MINANSPLRQIAASVGKVYGAEIDSTYLYSDPTYTALLAAQCGIATPNGELKWNATEPSPGEFDFTNADIIAGFCQANEMQLHGHTLLWGQALPSYITSFPPSMSDLQRHVAGVMGHYVNSTVLTSWDIANEIIASGPDATSDQTYGLLPGLTPEYILELFQYAASIDSSKLFYLNDSSMEGATWRSNCWLNLFEYLKNNGAKIDGAGIESHLYFSSGYAFDAAGFTTVLQRLNALGVKPVVTELDIIIDFPLPATIPLLDQAVANAYTTYLDICFSQGVDTVINWGITDKYSWLTAPPYEPPQFTADPAAQPFIRPLPYDANYQPKLARTAIANAFLSV